ncbi:MAG: zinc-binding dehydrogenase [Candidatus Dormibacteria bacterium]
MPLTMTGVVLPGERHLELRSFPVPEPGAGEVLVRMRASTLCGSDLRAIYRPAVQGHGPEAYRGVIAGHEPCGVVERTGPGVRAFRAGERVILYHIVGCGTCQACRTGWMISCSSPDRAAYGWQRDGGHADFVLADQRTLVHLPDELTAVDGAIVACGYGTAYAACLRAGVSGLDRVLVTGMGPVGMGAALLSQAMGARVTGVELNPERAALARQAGVQEVVSGDEVEVAARAASEGRGFEVAIDCSGAAPARRLCLELARDWGRVVFVGEGGTVDFAPSPLLIHKQLALHGSWVCSISQMEDLVELLVRWRMHPEVIVTHRFPLDQAEEAYRLFDTGESGKVAITWE